MNIPSSSNDLQIHHIDAGYFFAATGKEKSLISEEEQWPLFLPQLSLFVDS
jgi:hypothetical protein